MISMKVYLAVITTKDVYSNLYKSVRAEDIRSARVLIAEKLSRSGYQDARLYEEGYSNKGYTVKFVGSIGAYPRPWYTVGTKKEKHRLYSYAGKKGSII